MNISYINLHVMIDLNYIRLDIFGVKSVQAYLLLHTPLHSIAFKSHSIALETHTCTIALEYHSIVYNLIDFHPSYHTIE